ncbi:uncharacterized protein PV09_01818 [Verruconis gallopava]|uniref:Uncharacterized protein n=1 Tax=Verruconis gallopava TaxID=253628 RepID=A0A0D2AMD4_9PEZI|nr:uncharacterized protein PV09_01818 [Verruconis gallopava]KIW07908.1 hypothetical protein PV09_01818 [Verruconis gallopava]
MLMANLEVTSGQSTHSSISTQITSSRQQLQPCEPRTVESLYYLFHVSLQDLLLEQGNTIPSGHIESYSKAPSEAASTFYAHGCQVQPPKGTFSLLPLFAGLLAETECQSARYSLLSSVLRPLGNVHRLILVSVAHLTE